jgi:CheY-like chemotaxis protein
VLLCPDRQLTDRDRSRLRRYTPQLKTTLVASAEQLTAETAVALHRTPVRPAAEWSVERPVPDDSLRGRKVLLVDDDVRNLFALASLLEDRGMEVVFGETGQEALAALERQPDIEIVLMDLMMPGMDGYETMAATREMPQFGDLPIIAVTAKAMQGDREKCLQWGASDYITKPVEPEKLMALIRGWLGD